MLNKRLLSLTISCLFACMAYGQSTKPKVYIDPKGQRYSRTQFDSITAANRGKPIATIDVTEKDKETEITFEVMAVNPNDAFREKWVGKPLPTFSLKDRQGNVYSNASLKNKLIVINFWSTTCIPCLKEMPVLSDLEAKYKGDKIVFIAPAPESAEQVNRILSKRKFTYTVLPKAEPLFSALTIEGYPYHFVVDQAGIIQAIFSGASINPQTNQPIVDERLVEAIDQALTK
ncbi:TlpA family protein disulfide reductase [Spirosoma sp. KUDC1026]|uniref:TlpA family protein disulfide reductase n=1 Tax=Spirosoma sp. KUDC1026 TaxID=2745947 RepID=UPI00159BA719|nr:TlpA disulfide reductase family protein [Spirosoma sp. KUDC1026]QKZ11325.1 TlpA family protein disulfide reductase [Spirosoma sp. KUDC1026]